MKKPPSTSARETSARETHDRKTHRRGLAGETVASLYLAAKGYRILERRFRTPQGEIDLIVRRGRIVAFVEVKVRPGLAEALESVTPRQQRRIVAAAGLWMASAAPPDDCDFRFDVVAVTGRAIPRHIEGAFTADAF